MGPWLSRPLEARERDFRGSAFLNNQLAAFFSWPSRKFKGHQFSQLAQLLKQLIEETFLGTYWIAQEAPAPQMYLLSEKKKKN